MKEPFIRDTVGHRAKVQTKVQKLANLAKVNISVFSLFCSSGSLFNTVSPIGKRAEYTVSQSYELINNQIIRVNAPIK